MDKEKIGEGEKGDKEKGDRREAVSTMWHYSLAIRLCKAKKRGNICLEHEC